MALEGALPASPRREDAERRALDAESADAGRDKYDANYDARFESVSPGGDLPAGPGTDPDPDPGDDSGRGAESADASHDDAPVLLTPSAMILADLERQGASDSRRLRWTITVAALFHAILLLVTFPKWNHEPQRVGQPNKVFVMEQMRFQKPPPEKAQQRQEIPDPEKKRIPIPDPTPDDPEPIRVEDLEIPELPTTDAEELFFGIPDAPDPGQRVMNAGFEGQAMQVGSGIAAPVKSIWAQPRYTETARQARIEGVVILSCIIDEEGNVRNLKAVKGLTMGLTESALESVAEWKYEPARNADGQPVPVYYHITVGFWLQ